MIDNKMQLNPSYKSVADFYSGRSVFITGATGFLGKVIIEKLLYNCPYIDKIYALVREKKGVRPDQRIHSIIDNTLFGRLKEKQPDSLKKLILIPGDVALPNLGIDPENENILKDNVSVVFHAAATVKFNGPLKETLKINYEGTEKILQLCKKMKRIEILIYISTAYAHCNKDTIEEIIYPPSADINDVYSRVDLVEETRGTVDLLNGLPNIYTLSKALTEGLIVRDHGSIPSVIIRPSIVSPILKGPIIEGWLDNWYGATPLCVAFAKGLNRAICGSPDNIIDLMPVDYVVNCMIVAATRAPRFNNVFVYNCCSSSSNPTTIGHIIRTFVEESIKHRSYVVPYPQLYIITKYKVFVKLVTIFLQIIPAYILDFLRIIFRKSPRYVNMQSKISLVREAQEYFSSRSWIIKNDHVRKLHASLSSQDKELFPMDPSDIDWTNYFPIYCAGVRKYLENIE